MRISGSIYLVYALAFFFSVGILKARHPLQQKRTWMPNSTLDNTTPGSLMGSDYTFNLNFKLSFLLLKK